MGKQPSLVVRAKIEALQRDGADVEATTRRQIAWDSVGADHGSVKESVVEEHKWLIEPINFGEGIGVRTDTFIGGYTLKVCFTNFSSIEIS